MQKTQMQPLPKIDMETILSLEGEFYWAGNNPLLKGYIDTFSSTEISKDMLIPRILSYFVYNAIDMKLRKEGKKQVLLLPTSLR